MKKIAPLMLVLVLAALSFGVSVDAQTPPAPPFSEDTKAELVNMVRVEHPQMSMDQTHFSPTNTSPRSFPITSGKVPIHFDPMAHLSPAAQQEMMNATAADYIAAAQEHIALAVAFASLGNSMHEDDVTFPLPIQ